MIGETEMIHINRKRVYIERANVLQWLPEDPQLTGVHSTHSFSRMYEPIKIAVSGWGYAEVVISIHHTNNSPLE